MQIIGTLTIFGLDKSVQKINLKTPFLSNERGQMRTRDELAKIALSVALDTSKSLYHSHHLQLNS